MELKIISKKATQWIQKYKFIALIIIAGLVLMWLPTGDKETNTIKSDDMTDISKAISFEEELEETLNQIKGAGKVKVMLTVAQGEETVYQTNNTLSINNDTTKEDMDTVTIADADRNQNGLIKQTNPPIYMGAIIICQGADDPTVRLAITDAVAKITGLKTNSISVLKMK